MLNLNDKWWIVKAIIFGMILILALIDTTFYDFDKVKKYELSYGDRRGTYYGQYEDGIPNGSGILELKNKEKIKYLYRGDFVDGHFEGEGKILWSYGEDAKYEVGTYKNDEIVPIKLEEEKTDLLWNTEEYLYHCIEFTGAIEGEPEYNEDFVSFNVICDLENNDNTLTVNVYDPDFEVETGGYVKVMGVVESYYTEENKNGEETTAPIIVAYEYDVISYEEALSPELIKKDPEKEYLRPVWYMK